MILSPILLPAGPLREMSSPTALLRIVSSLAVLVLALMLAVAVGLVTTDDAAAGDGTRIAVFGDVNDSAYGDTPNPVFGSVCSAIAASGSTVAISPGDALLDVADTSTATALARWDAYFAVETPRLGAVMPIWRTAGDNDRVDVAARLTAWNQVFADYPTNPDASRRWYSTNLDGVHVVFLNSAYAGHVGYIGYVSETSSSNSAEAAWLISDLKAASAGDDPATIVVVTHYPILNGKTTKPYAGAQKTEALALQALFAAYGVDMVVTGDTHVYRRTMVAVNRSGATFRVPYLQIPPSASTPRSFGVSPIPALAADEAGWAPASGYRGFLTLVHDGATRALDLAVWKVAVSGGAVSSAEAQKANTVPLGGSFADVPKGCAVGVAPDPDTASPVTVADAPAGWVSTKPLEIALTATDDASGVAETQFRPEGDASWTEYSAPIEVVVEGEVSYEYRSIDLAGNAEPVKSFTARIETGAPLTTDNADGAVHRSFTLTLTASDDASGVASTEYRLDGGAWTSGSSVTLRAPIRHKRAGASVGQHLVEYRSIDAAGNVEETRSCTVRVG
jgi:hypothetical protein